MLMPTIRFRPRSYDSLRNYSRDDFFTDLAAGITVGFVALPLAMAFGIASGVKPEQGLITAIIGGFLISALGGSRVQIGGPAGAFVALLYAIAERYGIANLLIATSMAGVMLFAMGALRLGQLIRFVPVAVVVGFTNGIAVIIAVQQIKDFLGLSIQKMPANFVSQMGALWDAASTVNPAAIAVGVGSLAIVALWPKAPRRDAHWAVRALARVPGTIVALALGTVIVSALGLSIETIGTRFGGIPDSLPRPGLPSFDWSTAQNLVGPTISIALLSAIESLLCARVADNMTGDRHDPNQELMAQGTANFIAPFFGGIAATGTIARTVTNVRTGARTPVAGMIHALTLLLIMLLFAPLAANVPLATLAAILLHVAYNMGDWRAFPRLRQYSLNYRSIMLTTFALTVIFDLTVAVEVGLVMSSLLFIYRISSLTRLEPITLSQSDAGIAAYQLYGSLFFGSVGKLESLLNPKDPQPRVLILEMHKVINFDTTGLEALEALHRDLFRAGGRLILVAPNEQPRSLMQRTGFLARLGAHNVHGDLTEALDSAHRGVPSDAKVAPPKPPGH
ncbi:MAG: SulP family inorganic anion transporter [Burkholderiaceae bacterium]